MFLVRNLRLVVLVSLLFFAYVPRGAAVVSNAVIYRVEDVLDSLKTNPSDITLLVRLQAAIKSEQNEQEKTRGIAAYTLGCLLLGKNDAAQNGVNYMRKAYPASPYLPRITWDNLSKPCSSCGGNGSVTQPCPKCRGSGTCTMCRGAGSVQGISGPLRCAGCSGGGRCRDCNGTGSTQKRCSQCGGNGTSFDRQKAQEVYTSILREKEVAEQQRQEAERLRRETAAQEAAAKARQAEEERKLLEERRQQSHDRAAAGVSETQWSEVDAIYRLGSGYSDLQKNEAWKKYKGQRVEWKGQVASVSEVFGSLCLQIKMNPDTLTSDLLITLKDDQRGHALSVKEGQTISFRGVLDDWGTVMPITLRDGQVLLGGSSPAFQSTAASTLPVKSLPESSQPKSAASAAPPQAPVKSHTPAEPETSPVDAFLGFLFLVAIVCAVVFLRKFKRSQPATPVQSSPSSVPGSTGAGGTPHPGAWKILRGECCPRCYSTEFQVVAKTEGTTQGFGGGKGCLGVLLFGPFGWLCGMCGQGKGRTSTRVLKYCNRCGKQF